MNREQFDRVNIVGAPDGSLIDAGASPPRIVVAPGSIDPAYFNYIRAVSIAFVALTTQETTLTQLIQMCEDNGLDDLVPALQEAGTAGHVARRVALVGVDTVAREQQRNRKP